MFRREGETVRLSASPEVFASASRPGLPERWTVEVGEFRREGEQTHPSGRQDPVDQTCPERLTAELTVDQVDS